VCTESETKERQQHQMMETKLDQLVTIFSTCPLSIDVFDEIILILQQQTKESLSSFISQSFQSLLTLKHWSWQLFSEDYQQWINQPYYQEFFQTFASFNKRMIYHYDNIEVDTKALLLFPETIDQVNRIFQQIDESHDDKNAYITIVSLWFDNHSHFFHDNPQYSISPVIDHTGEYIVRNYVMSKQYKFYLTQLRQSQLIQTIFTAKMLFYMKTCSFYLYTYLGIKVHNVPYTAEEMLEYISKDYLQIICAHSGNVSLWSEAFIGCIGQLIGLICRCYWWDGQKKTQMKILYPTEQITCDHVQDLIRIIGHKPFYKQTQSVRSNDVTILMDASCTLLWITLETQNVSWLFRSNTTIRDAILFASEAALNDEVCLLGYTILGETLPDEDLIDLKIADHISRYFFNVLEEAWHHSSKMYKHVPIIYLLRGKCIDPSKFSPHFSSKLLISSNFLSAFYYRFSNFI
jgi:hypothetical protein